MKNLVICGDSFSVGIGCHDLYNEPYGSLLSKTLDYNLVNYAKGSSTNFSIFLQVKYAIENVKDIGLLCIGVTSYNRVQWFPEGTSIRDIKNTNVNYHLYPPYGKDTYQYQLENPMKNDPKYHGEMFTENYIGIVDYVDHFLNNPNHTSDYFKKFENERQENLILMKDYYLNVFDENIQRQHDIGVIVMSHLLLKKAGIKHFILTWDNEFEQYVPIENLVEVDWIKLSSQYPDDLKTLHTSSEGQREVYKRILEKINLL